jgi:hypothetical protein
VKVCRLMAAGAGAKVGEDLPLEWIVDVADAQGEWFIGTAYGYDGESPAPVHSAGMQCYGRDASYRCGQVISTPCLGGVKLIWFRYQSMMAITTPAVFGACLHSCDAMPVVGSRHVVGVRDDPRQVRAHVAGPSAR